MYSDSRNASSSKADLEPKQLHKPIFSAACMRITFDFLLSHLAPYLHLFFIPHQPPGYFFPTDNWSIIFFHRQNMPWLEILTTGHAQNLKFHNLGGKKKESANFPWRRRWRSETVHMDHDPRDTCIIACEQCVCGCGIPKLNVVCVRSYTYMWGSLFRRGTRIYLTSYLHGMEMNKTVIY